MKPTNVLLLEINASCELGFKLRGILESTLNAGIRLQQEYLKNNDTRNLVEWEVPQLMTRIKPALIFLISPSHILNRARQLFKTLRRHALDSPVVVVSDADSPDEMYEMIKLGAADFITPPLTPTGILPRFWRLLESTSPGETLTLTLKEKMGMTRFIGESPAFLAAIVQIPMVAECDASVLISGETGTGKEVCARVIHQLGRRAGGPFIPVNCAAIPTELVENELFGHESGAFTGAATSKTGLIQEADGGTLFLDEIDSLPLMAQAKLLRFLQEKEFKPLGSSRLRPANVRVITATNIDMEEAVREKKIRQDLYYRLNIITVRLPSLRERRDDILPLADHFLATYAAKFRKGATGFSEEAKQTLLLYDWPGNVRELEHAVERAVALSTHSLIQSTDLALPSREGMANHVPFKKAKAKAVVEFERSYLQRLLTAYNGNVTRAALAAHKDRSALCQLLRKHKINASYFRYADSFESTD
jgi:two-component system, NtrC family, response regulator GlrR